MASTIVTHSCILLVSKSVNKFDATQQIVDSTDSSKANSDSAAVRAVAVTRGSAPVFPNLAKLAVKSPDLQGEIHPAHVLPGNASKKILM